MTKIVHNYKKSSIAKTADGKNFLGAMIGQEGGYLWIGEKPASGYQGWFFSLGDGRLLKIIENIEANGVGGLIRVVNDFSGIRKEGASNEEKFFFAAKNCLVYELKNEAQIKIFVDVREPYKNPEQGRHYKVWDEERIILMSYKQENDFNLPEIFIAVAGQISDAKIEQKWIYRDYEIDRRRGGFPAQRWVFLPAEITASKIFIGVGQSREEAIAAARAGFGFSYPGEQRKINFPAKFSLGGFLKNKEDKGIEMAKRCAADSLAMLCAYHNGKAGLYAGLPWFFQFWDRDEAISLKGLNYFDAQNAKGIFWRRIAQLEENKKKCLDSADGSGWLFARAREFFESGKFSSREIRRVYDCLKDVIGILQKDAAWEGMAFNGSKQTWMDSLDRSGCRIEIQALRLNMYALAEQISEKEKQRKDFARSKKNLSKKVREIFFNGEILADGFDVATKKADWKIRPNIFLAVYACPELLTKKEWIKVFKNSLPCLWLDWGGLSTIDRSDNEFCGCDTGHDPAAYHNGDSWFWVNNIAAIVLARIDYQIFGNYVDRIFSASVGDILWNGAAGRVSEISSAEIYEPAGCFNQAWSAATFLELCRELKK